MRTLQSLKSDEGKGIFGGVNFLEEGIKMTGEVFSISFLQEAKFSFTVKEKSFWPTNDLDISISHISCHIERKEVQFYWWLSFSVTPFIVLPANIVGEKVDEMEYFFLLSQFRAFRYLSVWIIIAISFKNMEGCVYVYTYAVICIKRGIYLRCPENLNFVNCVVPKHIHLSDVYDQESSEAKPQYQPEVLTDFHMISLSIVLRLYNSWKVKVTQLCSTLCDSMDCCPPDSSVYGSLQARILEWAAISFSRESSQPRD